MCPATVRHTVQAQWNHPFRKQKHFRILNLLHSHHCEFDSSLKERGFLKTGHLLIGFPFISVSS